MPCSQCNAALTARAEQAEHSLAASERALAALRYQAQAGGCELSTVGENSYHCRADALCGLCRLRHRASQAERDRDAWRAKWEALETTRAVCCDQIERERDEARAELERRKEELRLAQCPNPRDPKNGGHCDTCSGLSVARTRQLHEQEQRIAELKALNRDNLAMWEVERDALKAMLAEAERENLTLRNRIGIDRTSWHEAEAEVKVLRAKLAKTEAVVDAAREDAQHCPHACSPPCPFDRAVARTRAALRALDSPVGGAATEEDACPACRCFKVGHHPGGCEGSGGNCGCSERFPEVEAGLRAQGVNDMAKKIQTKKSTKRASALPYVIIRASGAGCHAGELVSERGQRIELRNARRLWRWYGAETLSELAVYGASKPAECRFAPTVARQVILDACEIIYCQPEGEKMIRECGEWRA